MNSSDKPYDWSSEKNAQLIAERGLSFDQVATALDNDCLLDTVQHPSTGKYPNQRIMIIELDGYAYMVPYVEDDEKIFFKTIIPSRKMTKKYITNTEK